MNTDRKLIKNNQQMFTPGFDLNNFFLFTNLSIPNFALPEASMIFFPLNCIIASFAMSKDGPSGMYEVF